MSNFNLLYRRKSINNLEQNIIEFDKNMRFLKKDIVWNFQKSNDIFTYKVLNNEVLISDCFYISDSNILITNSNICFTKKNIYVFILNVKKIFTSFNELINSNIIYSDSNYTINNLNSLNVNTKFVFTLNENDIFFISNKKYRKIIYCIDCNLCQDNCPINKSLYSFSPIRELETQLLSNNKIVDKICTGCHRCENVCPVNINISDFFLFTKYKEISLKEKYLIYKNIKRYNSNKKMNKK